jgi:hypothetical protein
MLPAYSRINVFMVFLAACPWLLMCSDTRKTEVRQGLLDNFTHWLESGGTDLGKLRPTWIPGEGFTVVASLDIQAGEEIAFVPERLFIGPKAASRSNLAPFISHLPPPDQVPKHHLPHRLHFRRKAIAMPA